MADKHEDKPEGKQSGKLILFNHSKNPYHLPGGRVFAVGQSMECADQAEYDMLKAYKGISTTLQVSPGLDGHIRQLEAEKSALTDEVAELRKQLEKFHKGK